MGDLRFMAQLYFLPHNHLLIHFALSHVLTTVPALPWWAVPLGHMQKTNLSSCNLLFVKFLVIATRDLILLAGMVNWAKNFKKRGRMLPLPPTFRDRDCLAVFCFFTPASPHLKWPNRQAPSVSPQLAQNVSWNSGFCPSMSCVCGVNRRQWNWTRVQSRNFLISFVYPEKWKSSHCTVSTLRDGWGIQRQSEPRVSENRCFLNPDVFIKFSGCQVVH